MRAFTWVLSVFFLCGFHGCFVERVGKEANRFPGRRIGYVDTRVGSGGIPWAAGQNSPAVAVPFGLVKLGPDSSTFGSILGTSGYFYGDVGILGFSHTRLQGSGVGEGGILRVSPSNRGLSLQEMRHYLPSFSHADEVAGPGFYSVTLKGGIAAELTSTARVGWHRYRFSETSTPHLVVNLKSHLFKTGSVDSVQVDFDSGQNLFTGSFKLRDGFSSRYGGLTVYFALSPSLAVQTQEMVGEEFLDISFAATPGNSVEFRVALSYTSVAGALSNLDSESATNTKTFDQIVTENQDAWETILGRIQVTEQDLKWQKIFYTALYRSFHMPALFSDAPLGGNRSYLGFDKAVHTATHEVYSDFSLWDTFRTIHPLYNLIAKTEQRDMIRSLILMGEQSGKLPRWAAGGGHADSMLGLPAYIVISESYLKGITAFDTASAYSLMQSTTPDCLTTYDSTGYCPSNDRVGTVTLTLEYAYADYALSLFAGALGNSADATRFLARSKNYRNLWSELFRAFLPKDENGKFNTNFSLNDTSYISLTTAARHYVEGSPNHYRWYVPYDPDGVISLFGSSFPVDLTAFFERAPTSLGSAYATSYYWHGNQPSLSSVFLFNHASRPDLTQKWVHWIRSTKYDATSVGLDGNDDGGTLSSWFVLSALGIFPVAGTTRYEIVPPLFEHLSVDLGSGKTLTINAVGAANGKPYVKSVQINGTPLVSLWFDHALIADGAIVDFEMAASL